MDDRNYYQVEQLSAGGKVLWVFCKHPLATLEDADRDLRACRRHPDLKRLRLGIGQVKNGVPLSEPVNTRGR